MLYVQVLQTLASSILKCVNHASFNKFQQSDILLKFVGFNSKFAQMFTQVQLYVQYV